MKNKVVLVTGSSNGIGAAIIEEFARLGYDVVINYNTSKDNAYKLQDKIKNYNVRSLVVKCDVSSEDEVKSMIELVETELGSVDVLINNAAVNYNDFFYNVKYKIKKR